MKSKKIFLIIGIVFIIVLLFSINYYNKVRDTEKITPVEFEKKYK